MTPVRRRELIKRSGAAAGAVAAGMVPAVVGPATNTPAASGRDYDIPKSLLVDRVVRTTCSPNCTGSCGQLAFVRDGVIVKIQQAADYPDAAYNPRGCMKGLAYLDQLYGEDRIMTPLIRTGARGSGQFRVATWDEALDRVAEGFDRARQTDTTTSFGIFSCSKATNEMNFLAQKLARQVMGSNNIDSCNRT